ncbi:MAG: alpha/beta hydrolase [Gallionella sp.]|nr:alpha/beta hydrolase [Gallionella sp.]MDD4946501.1 alpha/beta hydrolase [Gallionella sp.]MDD5612303.1 alpha/beta hydrolase [Gallionella sp.]
MNRLTRPLAWLLGVAALLYVSACGYMWGTQLDQVFEPSVEWQTTPARMGMAFEPLRIAVGSGAEQGELDAWWVPAEQAGAPTVVYFHGNYRNIGNNLEHTFRLHQLGFNVLLADYRGYGRSSGGKPSERKVYEDAEAVWQYLLKVRGIPASQAIIYGHSLGGAIAINLAVHHPEAAGLITDSTFTSMQAMGEKDYGFLPIGWLLNQRFESLHKVPELKLPVLFIHGTWDKRVPYQMAEQLYAAAPQPKQLLLVKGGEHNNTGGIGWIEYRDAVSAFVRRNIH